MSVGPPAANGTMTFTGLTGHSAALARRDRSGSVPRAAAPPRITERRDGKRVDDDISKSPFEYRAGRAAAMRDLIEGV
jgi:hypothetical protein